MDRLKKAATPLKFEYFDERVKHSLHALEQRKREYDAELDRITKAQDSVAQFGSDRMFVAQLRAARVDAKKAVRKIKKHLEVIGKDLVDRKITNGD